MAKIGCAPCAKCNLFAANLRLTGRVDPDGSGGEWHECEPGQFCIGCGELWNWMHVPSRGDLLMDVRVRQEVRSEEV